MTKQPVSGSTRGSHGGGFYIFLFFIFLSGFSFIDSLALLGECGSGDWLCIRGVGTGVGDG